MNASSENANDKNEHNGDEEGWAEWPIKDAGFGDEYMQAQTNTEAALIRIAAANEKREDDAAICRKEPDLVKRAKALRGLGAFDFPEVKAVNVGGVQATRPLPSDRNLFTAFNTLFGTELPERPHFDTFKGIALNHNGKEVEDVQDYMPLLDALGSVQIEGLKLDSLKKTYKEWISSVQMNELEHHFNSKLPEWDGVMRLESLLIDLFKPLDTELNREFGRYFWLSLYCRINYPGCFAPMALSLFGAQGAGKSYFSTLICRAVTGDEGATSVLLDLSRDHNPFLREITGASVIANIGEMIGLVRGDLNKIKDFMTKPSDRMDQKYEKSRTQQRQWIIVMDGNKYDGLQRDDTGNRRFYPMFLAQKEDADGQPAWADDFVIDYEAFGFVEKFWQVMAECRAWLESNGGLGAYEKYATEVSVKVKEFNANERAMDRGTVHDPELESAFIPGMLNCAMRVAIRRGDKLGKWVMIEFNEILSKVKENFTTTKAPQSNRLKTKLTALGGEESKRSGTVFFFPYDTVEKFRAVLTAGDEDIDIDESMSVSGVNKRDAF